MVYLWGWLAIVVWFLGWPLIALWCILDVRRKEARNRKRWVREFHQEVIAEKHKKCREDIEINEVCRRLIG